MFLLLRVSWVDLHVLRIISWMKGGNQPWNSTRLSWHSVSEMNWTPHCGCRALRRCCVSWWLKKTASRGFECSTAHLLQLTAHLKRNKSLLWQSHRFHQGRQDNRVSACWAAAEKTEEKHQQLLITVKDLSAKMHKLTTVKTKCVFPCAKVEMDNFPTPQFFHMVLLLVPPSQRRR